MRVATIILLLVAGILAGAQLGKVAPLVGWYKQESGFSLVLVGWLASLIGLFVAFAAFPAGLAIHRFGTRRASALSFLVLAAGSFWLAAARDTVPVLAARLTEGLGYLVLVIAVPALLSDLASARWRGPVMAVWGGFVPIGFAVSNLLAEAVIPAYGERSFLLLMAALFALFATLAALLFWRVADAATARFADSEGEAPSPTSPDRSIKPAIWLIALAFGIYVVSSLSFFTFMPTFMAQVGERFLVSAAVIALLVPAGNAIAGILLHGKGGRFAAQLTLAGFLMTALAALPAFQSLSPILATASAGLVAIGGGIVASAVFAAIPSYVRRGGSVSIAISLVAQAGGIGTLVGPPLAGWIIETQAWAGLSVFLCIAAVLGAVSLIPLLRRGPTSADPV